MEYFFPLFLVVLLLAGPVFFLIRNERVYHYKVRLIKLIFEAYQKDINNNVNCSRWRWEVFEEVSYCEMLLKFWKPLDSFYPDKSFLE